MVRRLASDSIYLTFDDGLDDAGTPAVLDVLKRHQVQATFFLIANKIAGREKLLKRILEEGHAIGNHSYDHKYRRYFSRAAGVRRWLSEADAEFEKYGVRERLVGFRPPAGILTPPLIRVLREKHEPLILWNERFYDAVFKWTPEKAGRSAAGLKPGSIVLLHDRQEPGNLQAFCKTLDGYISQLKARGLNLRALSREQLLDT